MVHFTADVIFYDRLADYRLLNSHIHKIFSDGLRLICLGKI